MDLDDLLLALRNGEPSARKQFGLAVRLELHRFFSKCFGRTDVDDLVHDAFEVIWKKLPTFESQGPGYFTRWLYVIAANMARRRSCAPLREIARQHNLQRQAVVSPVKTPGTHLLKREQRELLERCKQELPDHEQAVIDHTLAGGDDRAFANEEGIKPASVRTRRHRATLHVQELIDANRKTPDSQRSPSAG
jgi:RNA polymerase sigma factor (sigma-70 family)